MMPQVINVRIRTDGRRGFRLWIPLLPVAVLLSPLVVLAVIVLIVACAATRINPVRAMWAGWRLLWSLGGTRVEIEQGDTTVLVSLT